jgi:hypothetical protein
VTRPVRRIVHGVRAIALCAVCLAGSLVNPRATALIVLGAAMTVAALAGFADLHRMMRKTHSMNRFPRPRNRRTPRTPEAVPTS